MQIEKTIKLKLHDCTSELRQLLDRCISGIVGDGNLRATIFVDNLKLHLSFMYQETDGDIYISKIDLIGWFDGDEVKSIELADANGREISLDDFVNEYFNG